MIDCNHKILQPLPTAEQCLHCGKAFTYSEAKLLQLGIKRLTAELAGAENNQIKFLDCYERLNNLKSCYTNYLETTGQERRQK